MSNAMVPDVVRPLIEDLQAEREVAWRNPAQKPWEEGKEQLSLTRAEIDEAEARLARFAPFLMACFPETRGTGGIIESPLTPVPHLQACLREAYGCACPGRLLLKQDSHLAIAGSVKARGGIYEVLKHTEDLALAHGLLLGWEDDYTKLTSPEARAVFSQYTVQVGSTGNLGLSIGIMSAAVGFRVIVHMSADARQWKKDLLRQHGVTVMEYASDYSEAVKQGRANSDADPRSYFVDDENSQTLFLGYAVAAKRLAGQLREQAVQVDQEHPLFVYIPCGVGGAPGGITFGLKQLFGDAVHVFFVEPTQAPCMLLGMATGLHQKISVQDIGLTGQTHADGLAVGRPSGFVGKEMSPILSGAFTVQDPKLYDYMRDLLETENIFVEPSACAAIQGPVQLTQCPESLVYCRDKGLTEHMDRSTHILWATGGSLVPESVREEYIRTKLR